MQERVMLATVLCLKVRLLSSTRQKNLAAILGTMFLLLGEHMRDIMGTFALISAIIIIGANTLLVEYDLAPFSVV